MSKTFFTPFSANKEDKELKPSESFDTPQSDSFFSAPQPETTQSPFMGSPYAEPVVSTTSSLSTDRKNILYKDVSVNGSLSFTDDLVIDGTVEGDISSEGVLTIGQNALIKADIKVGSAIVYGKVQGNITARDSVELKETSELLGDIVSSRLGIELGAVFVGASRVGASSANLSDKGLESKQTSESKSETSTQANA